MDTRSRESSSRTVRTERRVPRRTARPRADVRTRPPRERPEVPDHRYLAYGTSITEGSAASARNLTYVARLARSLGVDALNLGTAGTAYCEPAIADYVADRTDWDLATLSVSVNMANRGFTRDQFADRVETLFDRVAGANPDRPVVAVTLFPYYVDVVTDDDPERAEAFREIVRAAVADSSHDNLHLVEGPDVIDATGLTTDLLHPGDAGMAAIAEGLADELADLTEEHVGGPGNTGDRQ